MHIQCCLQAESEETGIRYPSREAHKNKDGHDKPNFSCVHTLTNIDIVEAVHRTREKAKKTVEDLGMAELLQKSKSWENPPIPVLEGADLHDCDDLDDGDLAGDDVIPQLLQEVNSLPLEYHSYLVQGNWKGHGRQPGSLAQTVLQKTFRDPTTNVRSRWGFYERKQKAETLPLR